MNKKIKNEIEQIAFDVLGVTTLETRASDAMDFYDLHVASLKQALEKAYELGKKSK